MDIIELVKKATDAANIAGDEWMKNAKPKFAVYSENFGSGDRDYQGVILDSCGNAHVKFTDKRSSFYKQFMKMNLVRPTGNGVIEIHHKWKPRQEHGLAYACAEAAKKVLEDGGVTGLRIWDYID